MQENPKPINQPKDLYIRLAVIAIPVLFGTVPIPLLGNHSFGDVVGSTNLGVEQRKPL